MDWSIYYIALVWLYPIDEASVQTIFHTLSLYL